MNIKNSAYRITHDRIMRKVVGRLGCRGRVLDVGCGVERGGKIFFPGLEYFGADIDDKCRPDRVIDFQKETMEDVFDVIYCAQVLEHVKDPTAFMENASKCLQAGGTFVGSTPFLHNLHCEYDYYRYTEQGIRHLLEDHYEEVKVYPFGNLVHAVWKRMSSVKFMKLSIPFNLTAPLVDASARYNDPKMPAGYIYTGKRK